MDVFWREAEVFAKSCQGVVLGQRSVAARVKAVRSATEPFEPGAVRGLVLHKGLMHEVPDRVLRTFFGRAKIERANEVFVMLRVESFTSADINSFWSSASDPVAPTATEVKRIIFEMLQPLDEIGHPNTNDLRGALNDIDVMKMNIKALGCEIARKLRHRFADAPCPTKPEPLGLSCRPARQSDIESTWFRHWCHELNVAVVYHRKLWELGFLLQSLHDADLLRPGMKALGFGCGREPIASYLASRGLKVTVTDLDRERAEEQGWVDTQEHLASRQQAFFSELVSREKFDELVTFRVADMNHIPDDFRAYDCCWSICALEHLGSIAKGLDFIRNSLTTLRQGGVAIHTTEFNYLSDDRTIDNRPTVLFQRRHFEEIARLLNAEGHDVAPLDFNVGDGLLDKFIDVPPYAAYATELVAGPALWEGASLKVSIDGIAATCFGIVVRCGH
jgi:2-polyprenyl-3-methyl-5-hydroxy-6-metoxy-1,4-benzoquinol methylase